MQSHAMPGGLEITRDGVSLAPLETIVDADGSRTLRFRVLSHGEDLDDFDVVHEKRMHLIVVRRDLAAFQHVHPEPSDGVWTAELEPLLPGTWRAFADFSTRGDAFTLGYDLHVRGRFDPLPLQEPGRSTSVDGFTVAVDPSPTEAAFTVTRDGAAVELDPYLGAAGHLVALREGDLAFLHVHPMGRELRFLTEYPSTGRYRLFLQFSAAGHVHTAAFTVWVGRRPSTEDAGRPTGA